MRLTRIFTSDNWKYAVSEILLIVIGVSLALLATSWYESQQERIEEIYALQQLKVALESDLESLIKHHSKMQDAEKSVSELLQYHRSGTGHDPAINIHFAGVTTWRGVTFRSAPYEQIKSRGFSLISNSSIRVNLIDLYEGKIDELLSATENDRAVSRDQILPYFFPRFRRPDGEAWEPIDHDALRADPVFENLLIAKQRRLKGFVLPAYESVIDAIREMLTEIDRELEASAN